LRTIQDLPALDPPQILAASRTDPMRHSALVDMGQTRRRTQEYPNGAAAASNLPEDVDNNYEAMNPAALVG
jgi:hypothetical protein